MKLLELRLQNFRQHVDTVINFRTGLTGIIGPNGAGKSTLLEALAWAIYGAEAARGTNETLRFARAGSRARVEVDLRFALADREYRVVRTLNNAEAFIDGGITPVATTLGGVTRYLQGRLGMNRREFFNTYFTGQKELQFLATMGPTERGRFLSTVLGYERLKAAQDLARTRRSELRHEIEGLRTGLPDQDAVTAEYGRALEAVLDARKLLADAERSGGEAAQALEEIAPRWTAAQGIRDRHRDLSHEVETAAHDREAADREVVRIQAELERIIVAEKQRDELRTRLLPLAAAVADCERLAALARTNERRKALQEELAQVEAQLDASLERLERLEQAPDLLVRYAAELEAGRAEAQRTELELEEKKTAWLRDRQDAETKLRSVLEASAELVDQVRRIREAGEKGACPTCGRPLGKDFPKVLGELEDQANDAVQDGKWWKARREQLEAKPAEVVALEGHMVELDRAITERARKHTRCEAAIHELETLRKERVARAERREQLRLELESIPTGYQQAEHEAADARLRELRAVETRAAGVEEVVRRKSEWEREAEDARGRRAAAEARGSAAVAARDALGFQQEAFEALGREHEAASERRRLAELRAAEAKGVLVNAELTARTAEEALRQYEKRVAEIELREVDHRHHNELDSALSQLRADLNAQVRPELSEIASLFLAQLTDGRYTSLEIDDGYNICVLDEGEQKPVISGGEEDVANLVLRLSLSQMIAERAGYPLSLLILDEVFGSLDVARRDNVVQLLRRLEDRFEQVILITHIDGLRESLDQILHVSFDERTGSSVVREEAEETLREEVAAD